MLNRFLGVVCAALAFTGCTDVSAPEESGDLSGSAHVLATSVEQAALNDLGRIVAGALATAENRGAVQWMIAGSPVKEGKLHLRSLLNSDNSFAAEVRRYATRQGTSPSALIEAIGRDLEFYLPVSDHRRRWAGEEVIVAVQLDENEPPIGFLSDGTTVPLSLQVPPSMPTLVIVPAESFAADGTPRGTPSSGPQAAECYENCTGDEGGRQRRL